MIDAKRILLDICTDATIVPRCTRVSRWVEGTYISLTLDSITEGNWFIRFPDGEKFSTTSVNEAEIKLDQKLAKVESVL